MGKAGKSLVATTITSHNQKRRRVGPLLVNFQHATCNPNQLVNSQVNVEVGDWQPGKQPKLKVDLHTADLSYTSTDQDCDKYFHTFLAIRDKKTGRSRLVETRTLAFKPLVTPPKTSNPLLQSEFKMDASKEERMETNKHLVKSFGQKRGQKIFEDQDKLKVNEEETEAKVAKAAGAVNIESLSAAPTPHQNNVDLIPPRDETAVRAELIYRVEHFLREEELAELITAATNLLEEYNTPELLKKGQSKRELSTVGVYFLERFLKQSGELGPKAAITLYMEGIIRFTKLRPGDISKGPDALQKFLPKRIRKKIFDLFTVGSGGNRVMTPLLKDKAVCYILALALHADSCRIALSLLTESVRVDQAKMKKLVGVVGAHMEVSPDTNEHSVILRKQLATFDVNYVSKKKQQKGGR